MPTLTQFIERLTFSKFQSTLSRMLMIAKMNLIFYLLTFSKNMYTSALLRPEGDAFGLLGFLQTTQRITTYGVAARVSVCFGLAFDRHAIGPSIRRLASWRSLSSA